MSARPAPEPFDKSELYARFCQRARVDSAIVDLALAQHVVFHLDQLRELGLGARGVQQRATSARLHRIHHAVYSLVPRALLTREGLWMAAVLSGGPGAVLSHRSCGALHRLRAAGAARIDVTVTSSRRQRPGLRLHFSSTLAAADLTTVDGIPRTSVARALLEMAAVLPRRAVERACDQAEILDLFDLVAIQDQIARNPTNPGATTLQAVVAEHYVGDTLTWSHLEEAFLALTRRIGLPDPQSNYFIVLGDGEPALRADFAWPRKRIAVETDGKRFHLTNHAFETDRRRDQRLAVARWRAIRTTARQIRYAPAELERTLKALYEDD